MKIQIKKTGLVSLSKVEGKTLEVKSTKIVSFGSGDKTYYIVELDGKTYEIREDFANVIAEVYTGWAAEDIAKLSDQVLEMIIEKIRENAKKYLLSEVDHAFLNQLTLESMNRQLKLRK